MKKRELYDLLDMENGEDFCYFENMSELLESDRTIEADAIFELLGDIDMSNYVELTDCYFNNILDYVPDNEINVYNLLDNIRRAFVGMGQTYIAADDKEDRADTLLKLSDELARFRNWYSTENAVETLNETNGEISAIPLRDALYMGNEEKYGGDSYKFDFAKCEDYKIEEYTMSFADLYEEEGEQENND